MNWIARQRAEAFWMKMSQELGELSFWCDLRDSIAREVCFTGRYEPQDTALVQTLLKPGMTFVDVGANWGYYTLLASQIVGQFGRVVSFEPDPRLFPILQQNIAYNQLRRATALQIAAANETGTLTLAGFDAASEKRGLSKLVEKAEAGANNFHVQARPVDVVLDELGIDQVDLLKMDIEGAEEMALRGMSAGLARHRYRRILLEVHPTILAERGRTVSDVTDLLMQYGYRAWWIDHSVEANRRAAYTQTPRPKDFLQPVDPTVANNDAWPHMLWLAPSLELPA